MSNMESHVGKLRKVQRNENAIQISLTKTLEPAETQGRAPVHALPNIDAEYAGNPNAIAGHFGDDQDYQRWAYFMVQPTSKALRAVERRIRNLCCNG